MALRKGRAWLRGLVALGLALGVSLGAAPASMADDPRPPGAAEGVDLSHSDKFKFKNPLISPILLPVTELRMALSRVLPETKAHQAFSEARNGASDLIDPRKLTKAQLDVLLNHEIKPSKERVWLGTIVDLGSVGPFLRGKDLASLKNDGVPGVVALSALNVPSTRSEAGVHSEAVIQGVLDNLEIDTNSRLAGASERQQCYKHKCALFYPPDLPTYFAASYDISVEEYKFLTDGINSIREVWAGKDREVERRITQLRKEFDGRVKERNGDAKGLLGKFLPEGRQHVLSSVNKVNVDISSVLKASSGACDHMKSKPQKSQAPGVPAQGFMRLTAARVGPCDEARASTNPKSATGLSQALTMPGTAPGGIDFSSLQLRYLSDPGDGSGLQYSFNAKRDPLKGDSRPATGVTAADQTSDAFFVWLALNPSAFWVNLNPNEPHRIVDSKLARTDAGRIMLEADLQMKKTVGKLIHPDTETGRKFWDGVTGSCMSQRVWILPEPATVRQDGDKLYIVDAPLAVRMEGQYLAQRGKGATASCAQEDKASGERNEQLFRSLILPKLKHAVNTAPEYAEIRRVYLARVAAEWYRELSRTKHTTYGDLIGKGDIESWRTTTDWKPTDTFDKFVESYTKGEFNVTHKTTEGNTIYARTYVYGGVDLKRIPFNKVSTDRFRKEHAGLSQSIDKSLTKPSTADGDNTVWLGSPTPLQASGVGPPQERLSASDWAVRLLPALLLPVAALLWWRRRRLSASVTASPLRRAAVPRRPSRHDFRRPS
ncbi:hypothetical protein [Streptomyces hesseae]|uniref:DUF3068 domain-containing protein n=1 Tax=Streptomyces hesseae TaxID=3075519 RepID=A0ABU2SKC0_9ACTN|nr:hypothetical protein [Streptomyces sp. DSM 40473]MDT0449421.1 hypothetical protein [Streptomyces sp. DSM 40473]